jgi:hypothetical protein
MKQNIKIKDTNSNLSEIELDKLLVKEGTIRKILKKYRDSKNRLNAASSVHHPISRIITLLHTSFNPKSL